MNNIFERTIGLIGEDNFNKLQKSKVAIFGLGGVGGTALESLARSGIGTLYIIDFDIVSESNLNRQLLYTSNDVGKPKVKVALKRLDDINPNINAFGYEIKVDDNISEFLDSLDVDYIIDAIDDVAGKTALANYASRKNIPLIMSLGMANRLIPKDVYICKLNQTSNDPLAKKMRYTLKHQNLDISKINVVCSKENPIKDGIALHSMMNVPSSAGLNIAYYIIDSIITDKD